MSVAQIPDEQMEADELTQVDEAVLDELHRGERTKGALVDSTGYSRNSIYNRLSVLEAGEHVECIHEPTRLFTLVYDPRDE